jgi:hypothetical protein
MTDDEANGTPEPTTTERQDDPTDTDAQDLQLLLEQIAASAGDPPEHGLDGVAARRRRRKRHRRGAVATAMTLAVAVALATPVLLGDDGHDVTAADDVSAEPQRAEMPDTAQLTCARTGIDVPVASIRPQMDGMHIEVFNQLPGPTDVWVQAEDEDDGGMVWDSGPIAVEHGRHEVVQPVPPGPLTVGCRVNGVEQKRQVELVDVHGIYKTPRLACDEDDDGRTELTDVEVPAAPSAELARSFVVATRTALRPLTHWDDDDVEVSAPEGYPDQRFGSWSYQPMSQVVKDDKTVALVYLTGDAAAAPAAPPWTRAPEVDICRSFLNEAGLAAQA